jgi:type II secretory pathway pseudopilin PulG
MKQSDGSNDLIWLIVFIALVAAVTVPLWLGWQDTQQETQDQILDEGVEGAER